MKKLIAILGLGLVCFAVPGCEEKNTVLEASEEQLAEFNEKAAALEEAGGDMGAIDGNATRDVRGN